MVNTPVAVLQGRAAPANMLRKNPRFKKHDQSTEVWCYWWLCAYLTYRGSWWDYWWLLSCQDERFHSQILDLIQDDFHYCGQSAIFLNTNVMYQITGYRVIIKYQIGVVPHWVPSPLIETQQSSLQNPATLTSSSRGNHTDILQPRNQSNIQQHTRRLQCIYVLYILQENRIIIFTKPWSLCIWQRQLVLVIVDQLRQDVWRHWDTVTHCMLTQVGSNRREHLDMLPSSSTYRGHWLHDCFVELHTSSVTH